MKHPDTLAEMVAFSAHLDQAFHAITFREFTALLAHTLDASHDYARGCWPSFREHPLGYCASRNPPSQGEALYQLALLKLRIAEETGRPIGCPGPGRCHGDRPGPLHCDHCGNVARVCDSPEACELHRSWDDARVRAHIIAALTLRPHHIYRPRMDIPTLIADVEQTAICAVEPVDRERVARVIAAMMDEQTLLPRLRWEPGRPKSVNGQAARERVPHWDGALQLPLPVPPRGEHAPQCPVEREHWNEHAEHDPDVCGWVDTEGHAHEDLGAWEVPA